MDETKAAELAREQAYFDTAAHHRDRKRSALDAAADAAAHPGAAAHLKHHASTVAEALDAAGGAVAFGRTDDESGAARYIGRQLVRDEQGEVLVVSWKSPAAAPYFEASYQDPAGLRRKRIFTCEGNTIHDFTDLRFAELATAVTGDGAPLVDPALLAELARGRTGAMQEIVATIQAAQYDVIRAPLQQVLVIEGGPGTGKTAVALHRVSYLLFHHHDELTPGDVLVVGPHPTFLGYLAEVLPGLGDEGVVLRDLGRLAPDVRRGRAEPADVARLKGDARMAGLLARALATRIGEPEPAERLLLGGRFVTLPGVEVAAAVADARAAPLPYAHGRTRLRERLAAQVRDRGGDLAGTGGAEALANLVERLWPQQSAVAFLRGLFGSRARLRAAADAFTDAERDLLYRRGADKLSEEVWSAADLPLLDEVEYLLHGTPQQYAHVLVDEAQDLSPMQLRSVARRCEAGSLTVVGDLAQSTGAWARETWDEVTHHLPDTHPVTVAPLRYGYRVPRQVYALAAKLLPVAAPHVPPPEVVRDGPAEPQIHRVGLAERAARTVEVADAHARAGQFVGIVCPSRCRREVEAALSANHVPFSSAERGELGASVNLVSPDEAKGLEFDAVLVVEPEYVVAGDPRGHRLLYVALTRTTRFLDIICVGEPLPLSVPAAPPAPDELVAGFDERATHRLAEHLAGQVRAAVPQESWTAVLAELERLVRSEPVKSEPEPTD